MSKLEIGAGIGICLAGLGIIKYKQYTESKMMRDSKLILDYIELTGCCKDHVRIMRSQLLDSDSRSELEANRNFIRKFYNDFLLTNKCSFNFKLV